MIIKRCVLVLVCVFILLSLETGTASASPHRAVYYYMVNSNADTSDKLPGDKNCDDGTGACTLRAAIDEANADKGMSVIEFSKPFTYSNAITINKPLVLTEDYTTIDASSQWGPSSTCGGHGVRISAHSSSLFPTYYDGMLTIKSSHNEVYGLDFLSHDVTAITLLYSGAQYNTIGAIPAQSNTINKKSNAFQTIASPGVSVVGVATWFADNNSIIGNTFGTDSRCYGTAQPFLGGIGIQVVDSDDTVIRQNLIADQGEYGIQLWNDSTNTRVENNSIGTNGTSSGSGYGFPNQVGIKDKGEDNKITDNVISCNASYGMVLRCTDCRVEHNTIGGRNCAGNGNSHGNGDAGIDVIGASATISNNEIVENRGDGIFIEAISSVKVTGNRIGPNQKDGVHIDLRKQEGGEEVPSTDLMIGGTTEADGNWIGQNSNNGIHVTSSSAAILGNIIGSGGVYATGDDLGNEGNGILIDGNSAWVMVGGNEKGAGNFIGSNGGMGVLVTGGGTINNFVVGNVIGLLDHYWEARGNSRHGVGVYDGAHFNYVLNNTIMASGWSGVAVIRSSSNLIYDNAIGTDGTHTFGNAFYGVHVLDGESNTIGNNTIAHNGLHNSEAGVRIEGTIWIMGSALPPGNYISQNSIFQNGGLGIQLFGSGNNNQAAPTIILATCQQVTGTACPNCHIEIFSDSADEGKIYEGSVTASASGAFSWSGKLHGPNVTATAEDGHSNTSAFSTAYSVGTCP